MPVVEELIRLAIDIEENVCGCYAALSVKARDQDVQDKFAYLTRRERQHEAVFTEMLDRLTGHPMPIPEERLSYIKDLADARTFTPEKMEAFWNHKIRSDIEALEIGIGLEKDCILLYSEIHGMFPADDQPAVDMILNEEKKHLSDLTYLKRRIISCHPSHPERLS